MISAILVRTAHPTYLSLNKLPSIFRQPESANLWHNPPRNFKNH
ncbi:hypothetical protein [Alysiella crassa]|nr:hypothetical protein [Alysiella crassa]